MHISSGRPLSIILAMMGVAVGGQEQHVRLCDDRDLNTWAFLISALLWKRTVRDHGLVIT